MAWAPMERKDDEPGWEYNPKVPIQLRGDEVWVNDRYQALVKYLQFKEHTGEPAGAEGMVQLSIHSHDRGPVRNWRHLQQIKNEVCGELRTAVEIFPPENLLTDTSNEYHLWVYPEGFDLGFGLNESAVVSDDETVAAYNDGAHKGRQEPWEPGLTTGRSEASAEARQRLRGLLVDGSAIGALHAAQQGGGER